MPTFTITVAYDGTDYVGWQRQANGLSIQEVIENALRELDEREVRVTGAGRTDAGVHALGQVAAFTIERPLAADSLRRALNARLPDAIRVIAAQEAPPAFHPRFSATAKTYRYRIWTGEAISPFEHRYAWHVRDGLDVGAMRAAAGLLVGRQDFAAFQATGSDVTTTVRAILVSRISECGSRIADDGFSGESALLIYEVSGTGFLRHMVRTIVGTLVEIGRGRQPVEWIGRLLVLRDRTLAGPTAPAAGLFLVRVEYGGALAAGS
jgi:tRNA pseudouridine38-40 synthase